MGEGTCGWSGCSSGAEATLDGRRLCRNHFYDIAAKRLEEYRAQLQRTQFELVGTDRTAIPQFLSELISQITTLVASAKFLGPRQRDQFLELSLSAAELYQRVQRNPRVPCTMSILVYRLTDSTGSRELTNTVDISKRGACIATSRIWETGEKVWIQKPESQLRSVARVAWVKEGEPSQFLMGLEILDWEDFWALEPASGVSKNSRVDGSTTS